MLFLSYNKHTCLVILFFIVFLHFKAQAQRLQPQATINNSILGNNAEPTLFNDVNLNYYNLLSANLQVSKDEDLQKVVFLPFKLLEKNGRSLIKNEIQFIENTKFNFAQKNGVSTFGLGLGLDNSTPFSKRGNRLYSSIPAAQVYPNPPDDLEPRDPDETVEAFEARKRAKVAEIAKYKADYAAVDAFNRKRYSDYYKDLLENSFRLTVGANWSLFEIIGGDEVDLDQDNLIDNFYSKSGRDLSVSGNFTFTEEFSISGSFRQQKNRAEATENQKEVTYYGGSLGAAHRFFVLNKDYKLTEDYYRTLFIPQVIFGATAEYLKATKNKEEAKDGITAALVITPFLDFRITPTQQFRIGVPIKKYEAIKGEVALGPFLQYTLILSKQD